MPLPLDRDVRPESNEPRKPSPGTEVLATWFGVPEPGFGGMSGGRMSFGSGGYAYGPPGSAEVLENVRVPIWSTKSLTARWTAPGPATPLIESDLRPMGPDRLEGTVANRAGFPLNDAILAFNRQVYLLGTIAPNATIRVELSQDRQLSGHLRAQMPTTCPRILTTNDTTAINRADLMLALMFHDAITNSATTAQPIASIPLHGLDSPVCWPSTAQCWSPRIDRPLSRLVLENAPSAPRSARRPCFA